MFIDFAYGFDSSCIGVTVHMQGCNIYTCMGVTLPWRGAASHAHGGALDSTLRGAWHLWELKHP